MELSVISTEAIARRAYWTSEIVQISGNFGQDSARVEEELTAEVAEGGAASLLDHLRLCGAIPESYEHDSSEEKLYSKYTDVVVAVAFRQLGLSAVILVERADVADVEAVGNEYSLVADAKAFRLSRTAKNQKDFKVQALDGWKWGKPYAIVVCPLYHLPSRNSQIYQQAAARNVCVLSYSHLAVLVAFAGVAGAAAAENMLRSPSMRRTNGSNERCCCVLVGSQPYLPGGVAGNIELLEGREVGQRRSARRG